MRSQFQPSFLLLPLLAIGVAGCNRAQPQPEAGAGMQALPVQTLTVATTPVPQSDNYVSTIKSRRSATINPQVSGNLTAILVHSGDHVTAGQLLMEIDPSKQEATLASQEATDQQLLAVYQYNQSQIARQRKLFADGIISKDALDQAEQSYASSKANYDAALATLQDAATAAWLLPNHRAFRRHRRRHPGSRRRLRILNDHADHAWMRTKTSRHTFTFPRSAPSELRRGLGVQILDNSGKPIEKTSIDFVSPQVDDQLQGILVKAPVAFRPSAQRSAGQGAA